MIENKHSVPKKLWNSFKAEGQKMYNGVIEQSLKNQIRTVHPCTNLPKAEWETICHNMACYAAWSVLGNKLSKGDVIIDLDINNREVKRSKVA